MTAQSWVLNEYVHVNESENTDLGFWVEYEPLDHLAQAFSLVGYILSRDEEPIAQIHQGNNNNLLLVGSDDVQYAGFTDNVIHLLWNRNPGEHYICVSYQVGLKQFDSIIRFDWKQEGF